LSVPRCVVADPGAFGCRGSRTGGVRAAVDAFGRRGSQTAGVGSASALRGPSAVRGTPASNSVSPAADT